MSALLSICPVCTEFETSPDEIKKSKRLGYKFHCKKCGAEYWLNITKEPDYINFDKAEKMPQKKEKTRARFFAVLKRRLRRLISKPVLSINVVR